MNLIPEPSIRRYLSHKLRTVGESPQEQLGRIVHSLSAAPGVRSVILAGSYSRGDFDKNSDIDLVVISEKKQRSSFYNFLRGDHWQAGDLSWIPYSVKTFRRSYLNGALFIGHIHHEGKVLYDDGFYEDITKIPFSISSRNLMIQWRIVKNRIRLLDDLSIYGQVFIECLSRIYPLTKKIAILALSFQGEYIFEKERVFTVFVNRFPELKDPMRELYSLRPFSVNWSGGVRMRLPFSPINCEEKVLQYRDMLKRIVQRVEEDSDSYGIGIVR